MDWITEKIEKTWTKVFPIFYENIIRQWLVKEYDLMDYGVKQPRIYYWEQEKIINYKNLNLLSEVIDKYNANVESEKKLHENPKQKNKKERYFCADGFYTDKNDKNVLMEAKSWIPPYTTDGRLIGNPHALYFSLADCARIKGQVKQIQKYLLVYWSAEADGSNNRHKIGKKLHEEGKKKHKELIKQWVQIKPGKEFKIIYIVDIFEKIIDEQPKWYKEIISKSEAEIRRMFDWLLKRTN
ncbi:MAG: hypothetical protein ACTSSL_06625 [Candidatus Heimdallarchaeaceae archaeon]